MALTIGFSGGPEPQPGGGAGRLFNIQESLVTKPPVFHVRFAILGLLSVLVSSVVSAQTWDELGSSASAGGISSTSGNSLWPKFSLDAQDRPWVCWQDNASGSNQVYLRRWNGSAWVEMAGSASGGGLSATIGASDEPAIALDSSGYPWVVWRFIDVTTHVYLRRWNGTAWVEVGGSATGGGLGGTTGGQYPVIAMDPSDHPLIAWWDGTTGTGRVYLRKWSGTAWVELGGSGSGAGVSNPAGACEYPEMALDAVGNPVVVWRERSTGSDCIQLKRWDGAAWVELGGSATGGGISGYTGAAVQPRVAVDAAGNPTVVWYDNSAGDLQIYLKQWNGTAWVELAGSATGGGVSASPAFISCYNPCVRVNSSGHPVVAWRSSDGVVLQVHLVRWDGVAWSEWAGSMTGGCVSDSALGAVTPWLELDSNDEPWLVWSDGTPPTYEVYLKHLVVPPATASLTQLRADGSTPIPTGSTVADTSVVFAATATGTGGSFGLEIEVRTVAVPFDGTPTVTSSLVPAGTACSVSAPLALGSYHWQARWFDSSGVKYAWTPFGGNAESAADFLRIDPPPADDDSGSSSSGSSGHRRRRKCGLLGLEALLAGAFLHHLFRRTVRPRP